MTTNKVRNNSHYIHKNSLFIDFIEMHQICSSSMASVNFLHLQMEQGKNLIKKGFVWRTNYSKYAQQKTFSSYYDDYFHFYTICEKPFLYIKFSGIVWKKLYLLSIKASADWAFILFILSESYIERKASRISCFA